MHATNREISRRPVAVTSLPSSWCGLTPLHRQIASGSIHGRALRAADGGPGERRRRTRFDTSVTGDFRCKEPFGSARARSLCHGQRAHRLVRSAVPLDGRLAARPGRRRRGLWARSRRVPVRIVAVDRTGACAPTCRSARHGAFACGQGADQRPAHLDLASAERGSALRQGLDVHPFEWMPAMRDNAHQWDR